MKRIRLFLVFLTCGLILWLLQLLLVPKYMTRTPEGALTGEYYAEAGYQDVIFIGDCEVYENFSPVTLWQEYGISSYIRGSAQQTIWQSYYLLEETFRYETPKVVVFNVLAMQYDTPADTGPGARREAYNRMTLDTMAWSLSKWRAIQASMTQEEYNWQAELTYLFPILRYHERWNQLTWEDFTYWFHRDQVSYNGYLMQTGIKPYTEEYLEPPPVNENFGPNSWMYLEKMVQLCEEKGSRLVLMKAPSLSPIWWDAWEAQIQSFAQSHGLLYVNLLEAAEEIGIDWSRDTYDAGLHLNVLGAEKTAAWFGEILSRDCGVPDRRNEEALALRWAEKIERYEQQKKEAGL